jgi:hypothetical protein
MTISDRERTPAIRKHQDKQRARRQHQAREAIAKHQVDYRNDVRVICPTLLTSPGVSRLIFIPLTSDA